MSRPPTPPIPQRTPRSGERALARLSASGGALTVAALLIGRSLWQLTRPEAFVPAGGLALMGTQAAALALLLAALGVELRSWWLRRSSTGLQGPLVMGLLLGTLAWVVIVLGQEGRYRQLRVELWASAAAGAWAACLIATHTRWRPAARAVRRLARPTLAMVATLVLAEAALRCIAHVAPRPILARLDAGSGERIAGNRYRPHGLYLGLRLNSRAFPDEEFGPRRPGLRRVACIGDSFSFCPVPRTYHFTCVAEQRLERTEILNIGVPGIGPADYAELLEGEALPLDPDLVVVSFFVGNDVADCHVEPGQAPSTSLLRSLCDAENVLLVLVPQRAWRLLREHRAGAMPDLTEPATATPADDLDVRFPWLADPLLEEPYFSEEAFLEVERARAETLMREPRSGRYALAVRWLAWMRDLAAPVPLAVVLIPDEFQVEEDLGLTSLAALGEAGLDPDRPQRILRELCAEQGLPVLDVLPALRAVEPLSDGRRHVYHLRDTHLNARGNRVVGLELARFLSSLAAPAPSTGSGSASDPEAR